MAAWPLPPWVPSGEWYVTVRCANLLCARLIAFQKSVERVWEEPRRRAFLSSVAKTGRLILLDRRGIGLSDRIGFNPSVDATAQDIGTVLDAAGSRRVVLFGASEGGPACIKFAADRPDRVAGLILFASLAKGSATPGYPHALEASQYDMWLQQLVVAWGGPAGIETFAPSLSGDPQARAWWAQACFGPRRAREP